MRLSVYKMQYVPKNDNERAEEQKLRNEQLKVNQEKKARSKRITVGIIAALLIGIALLGVYAVIAPGDYDEFAKCLTERGVVMYGEDWCQYTNAQKNMFGNSFKYINYEVKSNLRVRPTWVIGGKTHETVQSFERLSELTGCKY